MFFSKKREPKIRPESHTSPRDDDGAAFLDDELWRTGDVVSFALGSDQSLLYSRDNRTAKILPAFIASLLPYCNSFDTLDGHADTCQRRLRLDDQQADYIYESLFELAEAGLLTSLNCANDLSQAQPLDREPLKIATVGFVTHERPDSLRRGLISYIENVKCFKRECDFVVMDSTASSSDRVQTREMLRRLAIDYEVSISYAGLEEKIDFAKRLSGDHKLPQHVIDFALLGSEGFLNCTGANRNALLLHTVGDLFFSADDDTVNSLYEVPGQMEGLSFFLSEEPLESWFFPDRETALNSVRAVNEDALSIHERWLGRDLAACLDQIPHDQIEYEKLSKRHFKDLKNGTGRVLATLPGIIGDSGIGLPRWFLLSGDSRTRLFKSAKSYKDAVSSREMLRAVRRIKIGRHPSFMATAFGLDNRELTPPFFPVLRNQDRIFGVTLSQCFEDAYFCHVPRALLHAPLETRTYLPDSLSAAASSSGMSDVLLFCISGFATTSPAPSNKERLQALGRHLMNCGLIPPADFKEYIRLRFWERASKMIDLSEHLLETYEYSPDFWVDDIDRYVKTLKESLLRLESVAPFDLVGQPDTESPLIFAQRLIHRFGELLCWWPEIVGVVKEMRKQGQRIAADIRYSS
jgi:hypothetical protein